jgi:hypothetical protein
MQYKYFHERIYDLKAYSHDYSATVVFLFEALLFFFSGFLWWTLVQYLNL